MEENDISSSFSETLGKIMSSSEVKEIISSLKSKDTVDSTERSDKSKSETANDSFSLPPEMMAKLPQMISALSGLGIGQSSAPSEKETPTQNNRNDKQRKALLTSLRPYLNPRRQTIVDSMIQLEGLGKLLSTAGLGNNGNTQTERR